jgi:hypothetical protein
MFFFKEEAVNQMISSRIEEIKKMYYKEKYTDITLNELPQDLQDYVVVRMESFLNE